MEASGLLLPFPLSDLSRRKTLLMRLTYLPRLLRRSTSFTSFGSTAGAALDDDMVLLSWACLHGGIRWVVGLWVFARFSKCGGGGDGVQRFSMQARYPRVWLLGLTETRRNVGRTGGAVEGSQAARWSVGEGDGESESGKLSCQRAWRAGAAGRAKRRMVLRFCMGSRAAAAAAAERGRESARLDSTPNTTAHRRR